MELGVEEKEILMSSRSERPRELNVMFYMGQGGMWETGTLHVSFNKLSWVRVNMRYSVADILLLFFFFILLALWGLLPPTLFLKNLASTSLITHPRNVCFIIRSNLRMFLNLNSSITSVWLHTKSTKRCKTKGPNERDAVRLTRIFCMGIKNGDFSHKVWVIHKCL